MLPQGANEEDDHSCCCDCQQRPPRSPPSSNHMLLPLAGQGGGGSAYIALLPPSASSAGALILPLARRQRLPPPPERLGRVDAAETSEEEEEEKSVPSAPPTVSAPPPPPGKPEPTVAPASVEAGELITSAVSGRSYAVLLTIAGAAVGHGKKHTSILLAAPLPVRLKEGEGVGGGLHPSKQTTTTARVVIKVIQQASYMQRYADAPPANGRAIGELAAHQRLVLPITTTATATSTSPAPDTHVLPLLDVLADPTHIYMVFPYADGPDLFDAVAATRRGLPEHEARRYFVDIALGVLFLKRCGVSHGDLSLENACLHRQPDGAFSCHLIDLEMARLVSVDGAISPTTLLAARLGLSHAGGKPGYISPEGAYGTMLDSHATDMWSLGVCLYVMLTARPLYTHPKDRAFEILACGGAPSLIDHYSVTYGLTLPPGAAALVISLLQPDPRDRPTVEDVLLHPWVNDGGEGQQQQQQQQQWWPPAVIPETTRGMEKQ